MIYSTVATRLLLKRGVLDINETDDKGRTLLSHAVEHTSAKLVKMLLEEGAEPNLIAYEGWTPLWRAMNVVRYIPNGNTNILHVVRLQIEYGAVLDEDGRKKLETWYGKKWTIWWVLQAANKFNGWKYF